MKRSNIVNSGIKFADPKDVKTFVKLLKIDTYTQNKWINCDSQSSNDALGIIERKTSKKLEFGGSQIDVHFTFTLELNNPNFEQSDEQPIFVVRNRVSVDLVDIFYDGEDFDVYRHVDEFVQSIEQFKERATDDARDMLIKSLDYSNYFFNITGVPYCELDHEDAPFFMDTEYVSKLSDSQYDYDGLKDFLVTELVLNNPESFYII
jgi:hypothetical protein